MILTNKIRLRPHLHQLDFNHTNGNGHRKLNLHWHVLVIYQSAIPNLTLNPHELRLLQPLMKPLSLLCFAFASASIFGREKKTTKTIEEISRLPVSDALVKIKDLESKKSLDENNRSALIEKKNELLKKIVSPNFNEDSNIVREFLQSKNQELLRLRRMLSLVQVDSIYQLVETKAVDFQKLKELTTKLLELQKKPKDEQSPSIEFLIKEQKALLETLQAIKKDPQEEVKSEDLISQLESLVFSSEEGWDLIKLLETRGKIRKFQDDLELKSLQKLEVKRPWRKDYLGPFKKCSYFSQLAGAVKGIVKIETLEDTLSEAISKVSQDLLTKPPNYDRFWNLLQVKIGIKEEQAKEIREKLKTATIECINERMGKFPSKDPEGLDTWNKLLLRARDELNDYGCIRSAKIFFDDVRTIISSNKYDQLAKWTVLEQLDPQFKGK